MNGVTRKLGVALIVSVAINLFLAGMLAADLWRSRAAAAPPAAGGPSGGSLLFRAGEILKDPKDPGLERVLRRHTGPLRQRRQGLSDARLRVQEALEAEPYDDHRLAQALASLREESGRSQETLHSALQELARGMTAEQRRRLAAQAVAGGKRRHRGR